MSKGDALGQKIRKMQDHFFVPLDQSEVFTRLDKLIDELEARYRPLGQTFRYNLATMLSAVAMPFALASSSVHESHFQRFFMAERIRARAIEDASQSDEQIEEAREREAYKKARPRMDEFATSGEGKDTIVRGICSFLLASLETEELKLAARELVQQGVILMWSAFEILFRDTFELHLNLNPRKAALLAENVYTRKRFQVEKISLDTLVEHEFDFSERMGTVVFGQQDFSDLPTIKSACFVLFGSSAELVKCLNDPGLWLVYQRRHLLVHRRGIADKNYIDNTRDDIPLGSRLEVSPKDLEEHLKSVLNAGEALLHCLRKEATL